MKKLNMFTTFDFSRFAKGKRFMSTGQQEWKDFDSGKVIGTKLEVFIAEDKTDYNVTDGEVINNLYEKLTIKVPKQITVPMNVEVRPVNVQASVYGDYRNQLSVVAQDIEVVKQ